MDNHFTRVLLCSSKSNLHIINRSLFWVYLFFYSGLVAQNTEPKISLHNEPVKSGNTLSIEYNLSDPDDQVSEVILTLYDAKSNSLYNPILPNKISGDIGTVIIDGKKKRIDIEFNPSVGVPSSMQIILSCKDSHKMDLSQLIQNVDTNRIKQRLKLLSGRRNAVSDPKFLASTREFLSNFIKSKIELKTYTSKIGSLDCINLEAHMWGTESPRQIVINDAHYDSFSQSPGADDNASGVVGVMEAIESLTTYCFKKSVRFVFFDLEEAGLIGSNLYINNQINKRDSIIAVLNYEMIGYYSDKENTQDLPLGFNILFPNEYNQVIQNNRRGDFITNTGNTNSKWLKDAFAQSAAQFVPELRVISLEVPGTGTIAQDLRRSDHASFWDKNIPALMITDGANFRNKNYHTPNDSIELLNMKFMQQVIQATIASIAQIAEIEHGSCLQIQWESANTNSDPGSECFQIQYIDRELHINCFETASQTAGLNIFDSSGKQVFHSKIGSQAKHRISLSNFRSGIYFASLHDGKTIRTKKFIHYE
ncbi:MAG TPA: M20/M25/M40 family metallo-hydrolase [Saprospiraceae bacterium]|nr:M20/M25/M40 family metallo-hydrolase [Saprospiraceae bacterium]